MENLATRNKKFSLRIIKLFIALPKTTEAQIIGKQLLRSGTSVGAHYREAIYARSNLEFIAKINAGLQELEESRYWLELLVEAHIFPERKLSCLCTEAQELLAILITISKNAKKE